MTYLLAHVIQKTVFSGKLELLLGVFSGTSVLVGLALAEERAALYWVPQWNQKKHLTEAKHSGRIDISSPLVKEAMLTKLSKEMHKLSSNYILKCGTVLFFKLLNVTAY